MLRGATALATRRARRRRCEKPHRYEAARWHGFPDVHRRHRCPTTRTCNRNRAITVCLSLCLEPPAEHKLVRCGQQLAVLCCSCGDGGYRAERVGLRCSHVVSEEALTCAQLGAPECKRLHLAPRCAAPKRRVRTARLAVKQHHRQRRRCRWSSSSVCDGCFRRFGLSCGNRVKNAADPRVDPLDCRDVRSV